jgi:hypothetical protein
MTTREVRDLLADLFITDEPIRPPGAVAAPWLGPNVYIDRQRRIHGLADALEDARKVFESDTDEGRRLRARSAREKALTDKMTDEEQMAFYQSMRAGVVRQMREWERETGISLGAR